MDKHWQRHRIAVLGGEISAWTRGDIGKGNLLIIHGGPDWDHSYLRDVAYRLSSKQRVILFDLRGCGQSNTFGAPANYSADAVLEDIEALKHYFGANRWNVLGFSFGGRIALKLLAERPETLNKLILASTSAYTQTQPWLDALPLYRQRMTEQLSAYIDEALFHRPLQGEEPARSLAIESLALDIYQLGRIAEYREKLTRVQFSSRWLATLRQGKLPPIALPSPEILAKSGIPVLLVHGRHDLRFPLKSALQFHRDYPNSELCVLEEAGHMAHWECPENWCQAVDRFLNSGFAKATAPQEEIK